MSLVLTKMSCSDGSYVVNRLRFHYSTFYVKFDIGLLEVNTAQTRWNGAKYPQNRMMCFTVIDAKMISAS
jgi:hypothetical protein